MCDRQGRRGASSATYATVVGLVAVGAGLAVAATGGDVRGLLARTGDQVNAVDGLIAGNAGPRFSGSLPATLVINEGEPIPSTSVTGFHDPEGDPLSYRLLDDGSGIAADLALTGTGPDGATLVGTPTRAGTFDVTLVATDPLGRTATAGPIVITVDGAPTFSGILPGLTSAFNADPLAPISLTGFSDPEGAPLSYSLTVSGEPLDAELAVVEVADGAVEVRGTPTTPGLYDLTVTATDPAGMTVSAGPFGLDVLPNRAPVFTGTLPGDTTVFAGDPLTLRFDRFDDPDLDTLTYTLAAPTGLGEQPLDGGVLDVTGTPPAGDHQVTLTATDPDGLSASAGPVGLTVLGRTCADYRAADPDAPSGIYTIDPDGAGGVGAFDVQCQMVNSGSYIRFDVDAASGDGIWVAHNSNGNPWHKCADNALRYHQWSLPQDSALHVDSHGADKTSTYTVHYRNPAAGGARFTDDQLNALRPLLTHLHNGTRMVAIEADSDDYGDPASASNNGHDVYIRASDGSWQHLTPGKTGNCGGGSGSWPVTGSDSGFWIWHTTDAQSVVRGNTGSVNDIGALPAKFILPDRVQLRVYTGGGAAFSWRQPYVLAR